MAFLKDRRFRLWLLILLYLMVNHAVMTTMTIPQIAFYHSSFTSWCLMQEISSRSPLSRNAAQEIVYKTFQNIIAFAPVVPVVYYLTNSNASLVAASGTVMLLSSAPAASFVLQSHTENQKVKKIVLIMERSLNIVAKVMNAILTVLFVNAAFGSSAASMAAFCLTNLINQALRPIEPVYVFRMHLNHLAPQAAAAPAA